MFYLKKTQLNIDHSFLRYAPIETPDVGATRIDGPSITPGQNTDNIDNSYTVGATHLLPATENSLGLPFNSKGLHFCNINIRHILPNIDELRIIMANSSSPDALGVCETFLDPDIPNNRVAIDGCEFIRKDRSDTVNKTGGGLVLYIRDTVKYVRRAEYEVSEIETIWAEIKLPHAKPFLVCTIYRPPSALNEWIDLFEEEISIAQTTGLEVIIMGDLNIDLKIPGNRKWKNLINLFDLKQLVQEPTRVTQTSATIIDHVYTSHPENIVNCIVSDLSLSDHFPICFTRKINQRILKHKHITTSYRCFKNFDENSFLLELTNDLNTFVADELSVEEDFNTIILKHLNEFAPIKNKRVKSKRLPEWFTPEITVMQNLRDKSKRLKQWDNYKRYRNRTRHLIKQSKRNFFTNCIDNSKDTKSIWKHMRNATDGSNLTSRRLPEELVINNERINDANAYFTSIADGLAENRSNGSTLNTEKIGQFVDSKVPGHIKFDISFINTEQVKSYINKLDLTKATGLDDLGPRIIKLAVNSLSPSIARLINKSIESGKFPSQLKIAKVFPVFKGGEKSDPSNFRPISILPTISKIFEKHVNKHLMAYLNKYKLLHKSQSGFRQKHSCQTALVKLVDDRAKCIDNGEMVGALFIDFRKAFDLVDHNILLRKLSLYKCTPSVLNWFKSYLSNRQQTIESETGFAGFASVRSGVPQGSILGPTLFLIFINDLPLYLEHCFCALFANDVTTHTHGKSVDAIEDNLQSEFENTLTWGKENKMQVHLTKTTCLLAGTRHQTHESCSLSIKADDVYIQTVSKQKLLGVYIDQTLTWNPQIDYLCSNISSKISLLRQLSTYIPTHAQKLYYQGYILPLIDYGSVTWGATSNGNIERLSKLQKRAARIILHADFTTPSALMFKELGWLSVTDRLKHNKATLIYKALTNKAPNYIANLLKPMSEVHTLNLRSTENGTLYVPRSRTSLYDGSFSCSALRLWNSLPKTVRNAGSLPTFKQSLKLCF